MAWPPEIVLASGNSGKLAEFQRLFALEAPGVRIRSQRELNISGAAETASTFIENALLKARHAAGVTGLPALADDSGLAVDALGGAPGVRSARYAGETATDAANVARLLAELERADADCRDARFVCVLVYLEQADDPVPSVAQATWDGSILQQPRGEAGFGYDPVFLPAGEELAAAELPAARKNSLSHRGQATREMLDALSRRYSAAG